MPSSAPPSSNFGSLSYSILSDVPQKSKGFFKKNQKNSDPAAKGQPRMATSEASKGACKMPDCYSTCRLGRANFWNQGVEGLVRGGHGHTSPDAAAPREQDRGSSLCRVADVMSARSSVRRNLSTRTFIHSANTECLHALFSFMTTKCTIPRRSDPSPYTECATGSQPQAPCPPAPPVSDTRKQRKEKTFPLTSFSLLF